MSTTQERAALIAQIPDILDRLAVLEAGSGTPTLRALTLSSTSLTQGTAASLNIYNTAAGSTITGTPPDGMTLNSGARTISGTPTTAGSYSLILTEAKDGTSNTPRQSTIPLTVAAMGTPTPTPAPAFTVQPSIGSDGTPQVGEQLTGNDGTITNGSVSARAWLMGTTVLATTQNYTPTQTGSHTYRVTATGAGGSTTATSPAVTVAAAGTPTPTPGPTMAFANPTQTAAEGDTVPNLINITRNGTVGALVINLTYAGTAQSGVDYVAGPTSLNVGASESTAPFNIVTNSDSDNESSETIVINATLQSYAATAQKTITLTNVNSTGLGPELVQNGSFTNGATNWNNNTNAVFNNDSVLLGPGTGTGGIPSITGTSITAPAGTYRTSINRVTSPTAGQYQIAGANSASVLVDIPAGTGIFTFDETISSTMTFNPTIVGTAGTVGQVRFDDYSIRKVQAAAPTFTAQPSISGTPTVGQTLTGSDGTVSNGTVQSRQWRRNGTDISGATSPTYLLVNADQGTTITLYVVATGSGGTANATSAGVGPIAAAPSVTYLPTNLATSYSGVWSMHKLVSAYSGPLATACAFNAPDTPTTTVDIAANSDGTPNLSAAISAFGNNFDIWKLYDQTGNNTTPAMQTSAALRMSVTATTFGGFRAMVGGKPYDTAFDCPCELILPTSLTTTRTNAATLSVLAGPNGGNVPGGLISLGNSEFVGTDFYGSLNLYGTFRGFKDRGNVENTMSALGLDAMPTVVGVRSSSTQVVLHRNEQTATHNPFSTRATMQGGSLGRLGDNNSVEVCSTGIARIADVIFAGNPSDADYAAVKAALKARFNIPTRTSQVVIIGSSIDAGLGQVAAPGPMPGANYAHFLTGMTRDPLVITMGKGGSRYGDLTGPYADPFFPTLFNSAFTKNVLFIGGDTNGINNGVSNSSIISDRDTILTAAKNAGFVVVQGTVIKRASFDAAKETQRTDLNNLFKSQASAKGYTVCDFGDTTYDTVDGTHPSVAGYQAMAAIIKPALNTVLS